jgi:hypothetical protein
MVSLETKNTHFFGAITMVSLETENTHFFWSYYNGELRNKEYSLFVGAITMVSLERMLTFFACVEVNSNKKSLKIENG